MTLLSAATNPSDNDANIFVFGFLLLLAVPLLGYIIYALVSGAVTGFAADRVNTTKQRKYFRETDAASYWMYVIGYAFMAGCLFYAAFELFQQGFGTFFNR